MKTGNELYSDLNIVKELVYDKCGLVLTNLKPNSESKEYGTCSFELQGYKIEHRNSKITPTKAGQFVTIWKRNRNGVTEPFDILDDIDFIVITSKSGDNIGQFIFPIAVLAEKGFITQNEKEGKRGIRVYPAWDTVTNKNAERTQSWQIKYFLNIEEDNSINYELIRTILGKTRKK